MVWWNCDFCCIRWLKHSLEGIQNKHTTSYFRGKTVPFQSREWKKLFASVLLLCGDSVSVGTLSEDCSSWDASASYCAVEPGCLGSSGFPIKQILSQNPQRETSKTQSWHSRSCRLTAIQDNCLEASITLQIPAPNPHFKLALWT